MKHTLWGCLAFAAFFIGCTATKQAASSGTAENIHSTLLNSPIHSIIEGGGNVLYAATEDSGVVRSTDMGEHWEKFAAGIAGTPYISQFAINSRGDIFATTIGNGIYELPSDARVWQRADTTLGGNGLLRVSSLAIAPLDNS